MLRLLNKLLGQKSFADLSAAEYTERFPGENDHLLLDVRTPAEFKQIKVKRSKNIPLDQLSDRMKEIPQDQPVVVICATGRRSRAAASQIIRAGHEEVYNFKGGLQAWQRAGLSLK